MDPDNLDKNRNDSNLTAASQPIIFADGSQIFINPLSDKDCAELDNWVKARYLHDQRSNIPDDADEETKDRIERIAQQTASTLTWYMGLGASIMVSIDGMSQIIYQTAKRNHPELTYESLREKLFIKENLDRANEALDKTENLDVEFKKKKVNSSLNQSRKKKGSS